MSRRHDAGRRSACTLGVLGSVACTASMILAAVGVGGATAATGMAGMAGMTGPAAGAPGEMLGALVRAGPGLMAASALLVAAAFALTRRPVTAIPALLAGAVLYAGMYAQPSLPVMYASIAAGYLAWAALALWAVRGSPGVIPRRRAAKALAPTGKLPQT